VTRRAATSGSIGRDELVVALVAGLLFLGLCGPLRAEPEPVEEPEPATVVSSFEAPVCFEEDVVVEPLDEELFRLVRFEEALRKVAAFDRYSLDLVLSRRSPEIELRELAEAILLAADSVDLDPILLALVAWNESKFDPLAVGGDEGNWCGIGQILAADSGSASGSFPVYPTRPTCLQAIDDWRSSLAWGAALLAATRSRPECDGSPCLMYYWGEGEAAGRNERRMWRRANTLRERGVWP
jgi:hypothetical protein